MKLTLTVSLDLGADSVDSSSEKLIGKGEVITNSLPQKLQLRDAMKDPGSSKRLD